VYYWELTPMVLSNQLYYTILPPPTAQTTIGNDYIHPLLASTAAAAATAAIA